MDARRRLMHPIVIATLVLIVLRVVVLGAAAVVAGGIDPAGIANWAMTSVIHVAFSLALGSGLLAVWWIVRAPPLRAAVTLFSLVLLSASLFLNLVDPILVTVIGERLTPSTLSHFAGPGLFLSDYFWKPVEAYWPAVSAVVLLLLAYLAWMSRLFWTRGLRPSLTPVTWLPAFAGLAVGSGVAALTNTYSPETLEPVEISYVNQLLGIDGTRLGMSETSAVHDIRDFVGLPDGAEWLDDHYPLVYRWKAPAPPVADKPDIFIIVVESMRGASLRPTNPDGQSLASVPAIEAVAADGVVFRRYLSTGFPSGPGFVGISSGAWMHPLKRLDGAYGSTSFDRLGLRLRSIGYRTGIITYDVRYDDKTTWVYNIFEDVVDTAAMGLPARDATTTDQFLDWLQRADSDPAPRPLFGIYLTKEPHLPYIYKDSTGQWTAGKNLAENYRKSIAGVDGELKRLFAGLRARPRWHNTVIFIVGDHANFLDEGQASGAPVDDSVFTGAIIGGGAEVIGKPRSVIEPASHADLATTILALAGDRRPAVTLGRNLLSATPGRHPQALSIRQGGARLEIGSQTIMLPRHRSLHATVSRSSLLGPDDHPQETPAPSAQTIAEVVRIWAWMIENDRVWKQDFLNQ
jgi:hypothetical protein